MRPARAARAAALFGLLALPGCSWFSSSSSKPAEACPSAVILRPLANTAVFGPAPERRPENVAFYGILSEVDRKCEYSGDAVRMTLDVIIAGERGPAAKGNAVDFNYFVAVTGPNQSVVSYVPLAVRVTIPEDGKRAAVNDHFELPIALAARRASDLTVDLGFRQSPDVVEFYKHYRGR